MSGPAPGRTASRAPGERTGGRDADRRGRPRSLSFGVLEGLSFLHSAIYAVVLWFFLTDTESALRPIAAWAHGWGWILMSLLVIQAVRARVMPLWLAVCVAVLGGVGPFVGTAGFVVEHRRRHRAGA